MKKGWHGFRSRDISSNPDESFMLHVRELWSPVLGHILRIALLFAAGCGRTATAPTQFLPMQHVAAVSGKREEHDAVFYPTAECDFYPDRETPHRATVHPISGGSANYLCVNDDCTDLILRTEGLAEARDMAIELTQLNPKIALIRGATSQRNLGYLVLNKKGAFVSTRTLEEAQAAERSRKRESFAFLRTTDNGAPNPVTTAGKIVLGSLTIVGAVAEETTEPTASTRAVNPVYVDSPSSTPTNKYCRQSGDSTECTVY